MRSKIDFRTEVREIAKRAKQASRQIALISTDKKNRALLEKLCKKLQKDIYKFIK